MALGTNQPLRNGTKRDKAIQDAIAQSYGYKDHAEAYAAWIAGGKKGLSHKEK